MNRPFAAKLAAPRTDQVVRRPRVLDAIDRALRAGSCWVAAPAGYGKSTALADYLSSRAVPSIWYRIDEGDADIASFFHYLTRTVPPAAARSLPVFGTEYADQPQAFARRFFRAYFAKLRAGTLLVLDDFHDADTPQFRDVLTVLLRERPDSVRCVCLARTLPPDELGDFQLRDRMGLIDQSLLEFSEQEARALVGSRVGREAAAVDVAAARGWAIGLVLIAERGGKADLRVAAVRGNRESADVGAIFGALGRQLFDTLPADEQDMLLKLSLLPEITADLAEALAGSASARALIARLYERQLLIPRGGSPHTVFHLHDLLRDFLRDRLMQTMSADELARLRERTAMLLESAGQVDDAIDLALQGNAWPLAARLIAARAEALIAEGRRATLIDWCAKLPDRELDAWLTYWLGVASMADDATAEVWLERAWTEFAERGDVRGQCLTAARAVLSKSDSWRTHDGLSTWTRRALDLLDRRLPDLTADEELLVLTGLVRALDFADEYRSDAPAAHRVTERLLDRLAKPGPGDSTTLRLLASQSLIEQAGSTGKAEVFEKAVDCVAADLRDSSASPWALGLWLVAFGTVNGRYFPYARRDFPYASAEEALRAAVAIGERESLRGVEFGALYHLQLQMKMRNDVAEFAALIARLAEIADSRYTTQVAVVADCQAALYTMQGRLADAYLACERFMAAIEAASEPPIERWPHFITKFQVLLADRKPIEAAEFLEALLPLFDGGVLQRTRACVHAAHAIAAKERAPDDYAEHLRAWLGELRAANWSAILLNLPALLAELCADALDREFDVDYCRGLIKRRRLLAPDTRPRRWPWALGLHVLGEFRLERDGETLDLGAKPPTRSLDILRSLAIAKEHTCSLENLYEWLWPDADGDQAKAACEQALHRLRKLLGDADLLVQREGKLRLATERVWVDLDDWEASLKRAEMEDADATEHAFLEFPGPLFRNERSAAWSLSAIERVRGKYLDLADRLAERHAALGDIARARSFHLHALDLYPDSVRLYEALIRGRLHHADHAGALDDYARYERMLKTLAQPASPAIRALIRPLTDPASHA